MDFQAQSDADKELVERVREDFEKAKPYHQRWCENAEERYGLYRSYKDFKNQRRSVHPNDKDEFWDAARSRFGAELFIPHAYAVVETTVPRMLANNPRMLVLPRDRASEKNVENMKFLVEAQQSQIGYEMALQPIAKTGLIYGIGIQKTFWRTEVRDKNRWVESVVPGRGFVKKSEQEAIFDDPDIAEVDPFDFLYDPLGYDMRTIGYAIHRTWRDNSYVRQKIESGEWRNVKIEEIDGDVNTGTTKRDDLWETRMRAAGYGDIDKRNNALHEVWEWHDRKQVVTVLDNEVVVASGENPYWHGEMPFQIYRPTVVPQEFAGIGEIEPIEDLQAEINALRSQRRDNATMVLNKPFAFWDGLVDPDEIRFGAGTLIPVPGDPSELLKPLDVGDIPGSGYQEEAAIVSDIEKVSGLSDTISGGESNSRTVSTATGVQLLQQAASVRIQNKTRRCEAELIAPAAAQFVALNQQKIVEGREVRIPETPEPGKITGPRWGWVDLGPNELAGQFEIIPEGGSTEAENIPQMRQDAQVLMNLFGQTPTVDQRRIVAMALEKMGVKHAEEYLTPEVPQVDPNTIGQILITEAGMDETLVQQLLQAGQFAYEAQQAGQPVTPEQALAQVSGEQTAPDPAEGGAASNGATPPDEAPVG